MFSTQPFEKSVDENVSVPIGFGRYLLPSSVVARMFELTLPAPEKTLLEVGSGTGYVSAIGSFLFRKVVGIEVNLPLAAISRSNMVKLGLSHVTIQDDTHELFDAIIVSQPVEEVPCTLFKQLAPSGRLVFLLGDKKGIWYELVIVCREGKRESYVQKSFSYDFSDSLLDARPSK